MGGDDGWPATFGVEEEHYLVHRSTGRVIAADHPVIADITDGMPGVATTELTPRQIELATPICRTSAELHERLAEQRAMADRLAGRHGLALLASGTPPLDDVGPPPLTDDERYRRMARDFRGLLSDQGMCGLHVHVAVPDRALGVMVCSRLRQWLPALLAISANSPFCAGVDTGYESWRYVLWSRWPTAGPPPLVDSVYEYDEIVHALRQAGVARDDRDVYWYIRPSPTWPTVELRVADVPPTPAESAALACLFRAMAAEAIAEVARAEPLAALPDQVLRADLWRAARDGFAGQPPHHDVSALLRWVGPRLLRAGDLDRVVRFIDLVATRGTGAARQRAAYRRGGSLAAMTAELLATSAHDPGVPQVVRTTRGTPGS